ATAVVSIPLRYMHTPSEIIDLQDLENTVALLTHFAEHLKKGDRGDW
ncbi:MAG TPA: M42 family peptidase, partial [Opitutales bacterium]|nr:M42 family peptidase [Opitutales bacterium]